MAWQIIAKAILGGIGGGLTEGSKSGRTNWSGRNIQTSDAKFGEQMQQVGSGIGNMGSIIGGAKKNGSETEASASDTDKATTDTDKATTDTAEKSADGGKSDENLKDLSDVLGMDSDIALRWMSEIKPISFTYTPEAQRLYAGENKGVDDKQHFGVKAQDLEKNPMTAATVSTDEKGFKEVDTRHLTFADTAMISILSEKIQQLEAKVAYLESKMYEFHFKDGAHNAEGGAEWQK